MTGYITTIGLEIHVELKTRTKMFCDCLNDPDEKHPNINVCPVCMGHPGTLPVANREAIEKLLKVGMALDCSINKETFFERKNYFYPDLPKGYQISQYQKPFCENGHLAISALRLQIPRQIRLERIHLEEDAGRLYHLPDKDYALVDYNRAGLPLMELVTKPDLETGDDVRAFATELRLLLRYLGASDADMEKGQMRVEVNISLRPDGSDVLGTKVEVKNINSISAAAKTVDFEIKRQAELLDSGKEIVQETRGWDDVGQCTVSQRLKEGSADYRYFPDPDLPPIVLGVDYLDELRATMPELPAQRRVRFVSEYVLTDKDVEVFTVNKPLGDYFEKVASELKSFDKLGHLARPGQEHTVKLLKLASNYIITELARQLDEISAEPSDIKITPEMFADLIVRTFHGEVSSSGAQTVLQEMFATGKNPDTIIHELDLEQVSDADSLNAAAEDVVSQNPQAVADYKSGKEATIKFLVGKMMQLTRGKANPQIAESVLRQKLK